MTTKKDFSINENIDRSSERDKENESAAAPGSKAAAAPKEQGETVVKNAHAAGDGAFGRNEADINIDDDESAAAKKDEPVY